jgi:hypothetical protein
MIIFQIVLAVILAGIITKITIERESQEELEIIFTPEEK